MIGVIADPSEHYVVGEFFELFKTPWVFYRSNRRYEVLLCAGDAKFDGAAKLVLHYGGRSTHFDDEQRIPSGHQRKHSCTLLHKGVRVPIYGDSVTFPGRGNGLLADEDTLESVAYLSLNEGCLVVRIGYDLFAEVRTLLTVGQPPANASMPAMELHIALMRDLIIGCGVPLVEIPPVPDGYRFIACLTHDVDHPSIRRHKWDHTILGFLYRALFGSVCSLVRGQMSVRAVATNWAAAFRLPFVHLGLAKDFWGEFAERYLNLEKGLRSTFFVIPFKKRPGKTPNGSAPAFRAAQYGAEDIADRIQELLAAGSEIGLHGIDAWRDSSKGCEELREIRRLTRVAETGVRMHWLYYDQQSPAILEEAGAAYDSTVGYNETVGYRAGTTQIFRPLERIRLLELPMHVMDTALFYPAHLGLSALQAQALLSRMVDDAARFGGCLTINWHDRSLAPERLWDACYSELVEELKRRGAWFATAGEAVAWFRKRRTAGFEMDSMEPGVVRASVATAQDDRLPGLRLRIHQARESGANGAGGSQSCVDLAVDESVGSRIPCRV